MSLLNTTTGEVLMNQTSHLFWPVGLASQPFVAVLQLGDWLDTSCWYLFLCEDGEKGLCLWLECLEGEGVCFMSRLSLILERLKGACFFLEGEGLWMEIVCLIGESSFIWISWAHFVLRTSITFDDLSFKSTCIESVCVLGGHFCNPQGALQLKCLSESKRGFSIAGPKDRSSLKFCDSGYAVHWCVPGPLLLVDCHQMQSQKQGQEWSQLLFFWS